MDVTFSPLWSDIFVYILVAAIVVFTLLTLTKAHLRAPWREVGRRKIAVIAFIVLLAYVLVGLLDSVHFRIHNNHASSVKHFITHEPSVLDFLLYPIGQRAERSYSAPLATHGYGKSASQVRLQYAGRHLQMPHEQPLDMSKIIALSVVKALALWTIFAGLWSGFLAHRHGLSFWRQVNDIVKARTYFAWREALLTLLALLILSFTAINLAKQYHLFGTDKVGMDVFYQAVKGVRTGLIIGTVTTLFMLPFAIILGTASGFFGGLIDDIIQYIYTTLSSIPGVLLITAAILALQVFITNNPQLFPTIAARADARLLALCAVLGITGWTGLCRLLRAETLKLKQMDYVKAAIALGVGRFKIILKHILPNVMHIIVITVVLDFSGLVLAEAVLSYVGVGVDPSTMSWGIMINSARLQLAREPIVWWPLLAAFISMFVLVLSANVFADSVRDAFDPRLRNVQK